MNYVSHSYNNPVDFCINACTTDMNAVVYDTYHAGDDDKLLMIIYLLQVPIM